MFQLTKANVNSKSLKMNYEGMLLLVLSLLFPASSYYILESSI